MSRVVEPGPSWTVYRIRCDRFVDDKTGQTAFRIRGDRVVEEGTNLTVYRIRAKLSGPSRNRDGFRQYCASTRIGSQARG
jgi:hypothetical protein